MPNPIPQNLTTQVNKASSVLKGFTAPKTKYLKSADRFFIPADVLEKCRGLAVISVIRAGVFCAIKGGSGIVLAKQRQTNDWSSPAAISLLGLSGGFAFGVELTNFVLVLNTEDAVSAFARGNVTLGANLSVAAGPVGRSMEADVSVHHFAAVFTYAKTKGLFAGVSLEGAGIIVNEGTNRKFYGRQITAKEILSCREVPLLKDQNDFSRLYHCLLQGTEGAGDRDYDNYRPSSSSKSSKKEKERDYGSNDDYTPASNDQVTRRQERYVDYSKNDSYGTSYGSKSKRKSETTSSSKRGTSSSYGGSSASQTKSGGGSYGNSMPSSQKKYVPPQRPTAAAMGTVGGAVGGAVGGIAAGSSSASRYSSHYEPSSGNSNYPSTSYSTPSYPSYDHANNSSQYNTDHNYSSTSSSSHPYPSYSTPTYDNNTNYSNYNNQPSNENIPPTVPTRVNWDDVALARGKALYNFNQGQPGDLDMRQGDEIVIVVKDDNGWWQGRNLATGCYGVFPGVYVQ